MLGRGISFEAKNMPAYVIHYDLYKGDRTDYQELYDALENAKAVRASESTWFIATGWDVVRLRDWVGKHLHKKDVLAVNVLAVGNGFATKNLPGAPATWLNHHLN